MSVTPTEWVQNVSSLYPYAIHNKVYFCFQHSGENLSIRYARVDVVQIMSESVNVYLKIFTVGAQNIPDRYDLNCSICSPNQYSYLVLLCIFQNVQWQRRVWGMREFVLANKNVHAIFCSSKIRYLGQGVAVSSRVSRGTSVLCFLFSLR